MARRPATPRVGTLLFSWTLIQHVVLAQIIYGQLMPVIVAVLYYSCLERGAP